MRPAPRTVRPAQTIGEHQDFDCLDIRPGQWVVIGAPVAFDALHADDTPIGGPEAIRGAFPYFDVAPLGAWIGDWESRHAMPLDSIAPVDIGDLVPREASPLSDYGEDLQSLLKYVAASGGRPLILGGEHSLSFYAIADAAERHPGLWVVHFDAHSDTQIGSRVLGPLFNGNVMSHVAQLDGVAGTLHVGIREFEYGTREELAEIFADRRWISAGHIGELSHELPAMVPEGSPVYLTIDVDVLDPGVNPNIAWPAAAGLTTRELVGAVSLVCSRHVLVGADIVELASSPRRLNLGAIAASRLLLSILTAGHLGPTHREG